MKIAVIGTGISGNVAAYHLSNDHDVTVFEANDYVGGHTHTHAIAYANKTYHIDTGFIVFNYKTYPNFTKLLEELNVDVQPSAMSFSVKCERTGLEYNGTTLNTLFAQRRNLFRPSFYGMIKDILRFNKEAPSDLMVDGEPEITLGAYLLENKYGQAFIQNYLVPMGAAIWSTDPDKMLSFPARFLVRFMANHGMLSVDDRPLWYVIKGGSNAYVSKLAASFADKIRLNTPIESVQRFADYVMIKPADGEAEKFDAVFIASHSNQALKMLSDATDAERSVLGAIPYQPNEAVLHTDHTILPKRKLAWAAWNYHLLPKALGKTALTYNMNILQGLDAPVEFCVTLNNDAPINPERIIKRIQYDHPLFTPEGAAAQARQSEINGAQRTFYCGAYWGFGFHEDGVVSALNALADFKKVYDV